MMEEKEVIAKLKALRQIKPDKRWVLLTKEKILGKEKIWFFPLIKPVYLVPFLALLLGLGGIFHLSQKALPGERLYAIKKITQELKTIFVSKEEKPKVELELTAKRLEELCQIAQNNDIRKLPPAIKEVKETSERAAKSLKGVAKLDQEIIEKTKEIVKNKTLAQKTLGTEIETSLDKEPYKSWAEDLLKKLRESSLTENQTEMLREAQELFEKGDFVSAFLKAIEISQMNKN